MARIVLTAVGSGGDVYPLIPIRDELAQRGHEAVLALPPAHVHLLDDGQRELLPIGPFQARAAARRAQTFETGRSAARGVDGFWTLVLEGLERTVADLRAAVAGADLVLAHAFHLAAPIATAAEGIPLAALDLHPAYRPSSRRPIPGAASWGPANRVAWWRLQRRWERLVDPEVNRVRSVAGLPPTTGAALRDGRDVQLRFDLVEPWYDPDERADQGAGVAVGYPYWDRPTKLAGAAPADGWGPRGDDPLVVYTLGTAVTLDPGSFYEVITDVLARVPHRALVLGARDLPPATPDRMVVHPYAPLSDVLPHAAAVVHHGGAGTTQAALRHGCPSIAVPRSVDQPYHAARLVALDAGRALPWAKLTPSTLAAELRAVLHDGAGRTGARDAATRITSAAPAANLVANAVDELMVRT